MDKKQKPYFWLLVAVNTAFFVFIILLVNGANISTLNINALLPNAGVLKPKGIIALQEYHLLIVATLLMLIVVIPVYVMAFWFVWKYRVDKNRKKNQPRYEPEWDHNATIESLWWILPSAIIIILAVITWQSSRDLDPFKPLNSPVKPLTIEVISLNWKWLFIYPQQNFAVVNFMEIPVNTPINLEITSDAPMNSFWIPQLAGQIYAMSGMSTQLHLEASETGNYYGASANISGIGFADMHFTAKAASASDFSAWADQVKSSNQILNQASYDKLAQPSTGNPVTYYSLAEPSLYFNVLAKYMGPHSTSHHD